jgi:PAS domain S-box-containing protein
VRSLSSAWARLPPRARPVAAWVAAGLFFLATRLLVGHGVLAGRDDLLWPGLGVAFLAGLEGGPVVATAPALVVFLTSLDGSTAAAAALALAVLVTGLCGALGVRLAVPAGRGETVTDFVVRTTAAIVAALASTVCFRVVVDLADASLAVGTPHGFGYVFVANLASIMVVAPFLRALLRPTWPGLAGRGERVALRAAAVALTFVVNEQWLGSFGPTPYMLLCIVFWAALRSGRRGTTTVVGIVSTISAVYAGHDAGAFANASRDATALSLSAFLVVLATSGLGFASLGVTGAAAEQELREAERRYRDLVEQLPLVTYVRSMSPDEPPVYVSPQIESLLGYRLADWYADPRFGERITDRHDLARLDELVHVEGDVTRADYRMTAADGRVVCVLDQSVVLRDDGGEPTGRLGFLIDATRQKLLEEQLRRAQRIEALGLLAGGVAHDFNNLLMAISGYTELAVAHADDPERRRDDLGQIAAATERASELTRQLLAFARRQSLELELVDLNDGVTQARRLLEPLLGEDVALALRLDPALGGIRGDEGQLTQVLVNLAVNARDAMPDGGTLTIATANEPDRVVLTVSDTGHGIDPDASEHLFEPFFTTKGIGRGTGLGLATVHGIVEQLGGRISVESSRGAGATFQIAFARAGERPERAVPPPRPEPVPGDETVLLVEDEEIVRRLTAEMLERLGYRVVAAASPQEALALDAPWDVLVSDVRMPGMSGPELAAALRARRGDLAVVFMSGYAGSLATDELDAELLAKPFELAELARAVRAALDARAATAA